MLRGAGDLSTAAKQLRNACGAIGGGQSNYLVSVTLYTISADRYIELFCRDSINKN